MNTLIIARHQIRLFLKSPQILALFIIAPFFMIFIWGQAFTKIFAASGQGMGAKEYFGITLLTLAVFQGSFIASWGIFKERKSNTETRLSLAPVGRIAVVYGIFLGAWVSLYSLSCIVLFLVKLVLMVNYGPSTGLVLLILAAESFLAAAVGTSFSFLFSQEKTASSLLSSFVPLFVFLGGGYMPIPDKGFLHYASMISPIRWVNLALLGATFPGPNEYIGTALLFCVSISVLLLGLAGLKARRMK